MKTKCPAWLSSAVFYEIYPQSFYDSNADGIGDLEGIIRKLDYIQRLGCNAIWLNPCFVSPFADAGYDVADYYKVAPRYGTNADLKRLVREARKRGIRICLDLVPGHTSVEHPWFKQSCAPTPNKYSNWYIWTDSCWRRAQPPLITVLGYSNRMGNYITNFFWCQPALNYGFAHPDPKQPWQLPTDHPDVLAVKAEIRKIMAFWLDMGISGFRVDMAASLVKGDTDGRCIKAYWQEVRGWLEKKYPEAVLISEWSEPAKSVGAGFHVDFMLHFGKPPAYNALFRREDGTAFFDRCGKGDVTQFTDIYLKNYRKTRGKGYISLVSGNHDMSRISFGRTPEDLELVFAFLLTMPGVPFIYYGDEIGMRYMKELVSKEGGYNRTGARTPMQWTRGKNAGFSDAAAKHLYLPVDSRKGFPTVEDHEGDPTSLLHRVRRLVTLRRDVPALGADGGFEPLLAAKGKYPLVYLRRLGRQRALVAINPAGRPVTAQITTRLNIDNAKLEMGHGTHLGHPRNPRKGRIELKMRAVSYGVFSL